MKQYFYYALVVLLSIYVSSCGKANEDDKKVTTVWKEYTTDTVEYKISTAELKKFEKIHFLNPKVHKRDWSLRGYIKPDDQTLVTAVFDLGDTIRVIEEVDKEWIAVYVELHKRRRDTFRNKAYIKKADIGSKEDLMLTDKEWRAIKYQDSDSVIVIGNDILEIETISQKEFKSVRNKFSTPIQNIKQGVKIEEGLIRLVCGSEIVNLKDKDPSKDTNLMDDEVVTYSYVGFNKGLNAYLIKVDEWKTSNYRYYKQSTGDVITSSEGVPIFSEDNNRLVEVFYNGDENYTKLSVYKKNENEVFEPTMEYRFVEWKNATNENDTARGHNYFFGKDNCLYIKAIAIDIAGTKLEKREDLMQYIKIKINV